MRLALASWNFPRPLAAYFGPKSRSGALFLEDFFRKWVIFGQISVPKQFWYGIYFLVCLSPVEWYSTPSGHRHVGLIEMQCQQMNEWGFLMKHSKNSYKNALNQEAFTMECFEDDCCNDYIKDTEHDLDDTVLITRCSSSLLYFHSFLLLLTWPIIILNP